MADTATLATMPISTSLIILGGMPANLPPEAKAKWLEVSKAKTPEEKLKALAEFLAVVPKHKGTEKLRRQVKRQMAILRRQIEISRKKRKYRYSFFVEKEGDVQLVLLGLPNSGKSSLLNCLTGAKSPSTPQPFDTKHLVPGMFKWRGVFFQIVDTPSIIEGAARGAGLGVQVLSMAKNADGLILVVDVSADPTHQLDVLLRELNEFQISVVRRSCEITIDKRRYGGIVVLGSLRGCSVSDVQKLLREYRIHNAVVRIRGEAMLDDIEEAIIFPSTYKPALIVATKIDVYREGVKVLREHLAEKGLPLPVIEYNASTCEGLTNGLPAYFFEELELMRIYTRNPRTGEVASKPVVVKRGIRVLDLARLIHSGLYRNFRYARVWSDRLRFSPQRVGGDFVLEDGDIVEIVSSV